jgi:hypothetical protein
MEAVGAAFALGDRTPFDAFSRCALSNAGGALCRIPDEHEVIFRAHMNLSEDQARKFAAVVGGFYDAAAQLLPWNAALERLGGLFEIQGSIFEHHDAESGNLLAFEASGLPDTSLRDWAEHYHAICPRVEMVRRQPAGTISYDHMILDWVGMKRHPLYQEFLRPQGYGYFLSTTLEHDPERFTTVSIQRTIRQGHARSFAGSKQS